jgi:hypothetical protein
MPRRKITFIGWCRRISSVGIKGPRQWCPIAEGPNEAICNHRTELARLLTLPFAKCACCEWVALPADTTPTQALKQPPQPRRRRSA